MVEDRSARTGKGPSLPFDFGDTDEHEAACARQVHEASNDTVTAVAVAAAAAAPLPPGPPVYSQSGFDMLSLLGRVAARPAPTIALGPVDLSCAFVVADVRRPDAPIVYASRTFCELTGYAEHEVLGRNCRFLQAPRGAGAVARGAPRRFTSPAAVRALHWALAADKECQVTLVNYRRDGTPFVNRVSIVPVGAGAGAGEDIAYHVGFQVDLQEQPRAILERLRDGKYYPLGAGAEGLSPAERCTRAMSRELRSLLADTAFQESLVLTLAANAAPAPPATNSGVSTGAGGAGVGQGAAAATPERPDPRDEQQWLNLLLLEHAPDFVHVLSLKGHFLYVAPSVRAALGYEAAELVGRLVTDYCHPSDSVPLLRELKESSVASAAAPSSSDADLSPSTSLSAATSTAVSDPSTSPNPTSPTVTTTSAPSYPAQHDAPSAASPQQPPQPLQPKYVDLLFRMRAKSGAYVWVECTGRLHVEPGKGRKAVVLSGRVRAAPSLRWGTVARAGGLAAPLPVSISRSATTAFAHSHTASSTNTSGSNSSASNNSTREDSASPPSTPGGTNCVEREFWGTLSRKGLFLVASAGVRDVLGWGPGEMIGRALGEFLCTSLNAPAPAGPGSPAALTSSGDAPTAGITSPALQHLLQALAFVADAAGENVVQRVPCVMLSRSGERVAVEVLFYSSSSPSTDSPVPPDCAPPARCSTSAPIIAQFKIAATEAQFGGGQPAPASVNSGQVTHAVDADVFAELGCARGTSWQYELQQLKFRNRDLLDEVDELERSIW